MTTTAGWITTDGAGITLDASNNYTPPELDGQTRGLRVFNPPFVTGNSKIDRTVYRQVMKANIDYVPNDPYVLQFWAQGPRPEQTHS